MKYEKLRSIQAWVAERARIEDDHGTLERIAGADVAYSGGRAVGAVVVLDRDMGVLEERTAIANVRFPYIPSYLSFREMGPVLKAARGLDFDLLILDGQGIAHPRGAGLATHVGVLMDRPTIGVAKNILCGEVEGGVKLGSPAPVIFEGKAVGYAVMTRKGTRPIFVSPGHRVSMESALEVVLKCLRKHKLPEPVRLAHNLAGRAKRELLKND